MPEADPNEDPNPAPVETDEAGASVEAGAAAEDPVVEITQGFHCMSPPAGLAKRPYNVGDNVRVPTATVGWLKAQGYIGKQKPGSPGGEYVPPNRPPGRPPRK